MVILEGRSYTVAFQILPQITNMVYNMKAGLAATASLAGTAMAYNRYNDSNDTSTKTANHYQNGGNYQKVENAGQKPKSLVKSHDETVKQMQMWKF